MLTHELTVSRVVTSEGRPAAGALVALSEAMGAAGSVQPTATTTGRYAFQLPPIGRYVFAAYDAHTGCAQARKVSLTIESAVVNIDIPVPAEQLAN